MFIPFFSFWIIVLLETRLLIFKLFKLFLRLKALNRKEVANSCGLANKSLSDSNPRGFNLFWFIFDLFLFSFSYFVFLRILVELVQMRSLTNGKILANHPWRKKEWIKTLFIIQNWNKQIKIKSLISRKLTESSYWLKEWWRRRGATLMDQF